MGTVRVFLAIELPDRAKEALARLADALRQARVDGLRPVTPDDIHLTLKFLGSVPEGQVEPIVAETSRVVARHPSFELALGGVGAFPAGNSPRVLWAGIEGDVAALHRLQSGLEDAMAGLGFPRERRGFTPHLTLARIADRAPPSERRRAAEALHGAALDTGVAIPGRSVSLIQTLLRPDGARYRRLGHVPLAGAP